MATAPGGGGGGGTSSYVPPATGPVTPHEIYALLLQKGFSTNQAIGIMANMINESGLNPEASAVDSNGYRSNGLVQWNEASYPNSGSLVTNNPQKDVRAQITYLTKTVSKPALAGSTATDVAGNFAANFERCQGCQPGGAQWNSRRANVARLLTALSTGKWGTVTGSSFSTGPGGGTAGATSSTSGEASTSTCLIPFPSVSLAIIHAGGGCAFSKTQARALIAGLMIGWGSIISFVGLAVIVTSALGHTKAGQAAGKAAGTTLEAAGAVTALAGAPEAGAPIASAGSAVKRHSRGSQGAAGDFAQNRRTSTRKKAESARKEADRQKREEAAQERHTANQYRRQPQARARRDRDDDREPVPF